MTIVDFPNISGNLRHSRLEPPTGKVRMVLDTDTYNEIDDQFAVVHALLSPEQLEVEAIYAAPFYAGQFRGHRSTSPADGMEKSHEEILRLLERLGVSAQGLVFRGSTGFLAGPEQARQSVAADDLVRRAMDREKGLLYVAAIGAITNVASAILMKPDIIENMVVVWLGGQSQHSPSASEFNLYQDPDAARVVFDSGVPLVHIPCYGVSSHLLTTLAELERHIEGTSAIGDYLVDIFRDYREDHYAYAKEIWDVSAIAWLLNAKWVPSHIVPSSILTNDLTWRVDPARHVMREATHVARNPIFADLFQKIAAHG